MICCCSTSKGRGISVLRILVEFKLGCADPSLCENKLVRHLVWKFNKYEINSGIALEGSNVSAITCFVVKARGTFSGTTQNLPIDPPTIVTSTLPGKT